MSTIVGGALNLGADIITAAYNWSKQKEQNAWNAEQARLADKRGFYYGEMAADNADTRTRALYNDYESPQALLRQYKEAGISPSIMLGNGGTSGQNVPNGAQGNGASGNMPANAQMPYMDAVGTGNLLAQTKLIEAQTRKLNAETDTELGLNVRGESEIAKTQSEINKMVADTNNAWLQGENTAIENAILQYKQVFTAETLNFDIEKAEQELKKVEEQVNGLKYENRSKDAKAQVDEATIQAMISYYEEQVNDMRADVALKKAQTELNKSNIKLNDQQIKNLKNEIKATNKRLKLEKKDVDTRRKALQEQVIQWSKENGYTEAWQYIEIFKEVMKMADEVGTLMAL